MRFPTVPRPWMRERKMRMRKQNPSDALLNEEKITGRIGKVGRNVVGKKHTSVICSL